jgi:hypothetical protein
LSSYIEEHIVINDEENEEYVPPEANEDAIVDEDDNENEADNTVGERGDENVGTMNVTKKLGMRMKRIIPLESVGMKMLGMRKVTKKLEMKMKRIIPSESVGMKMLGMRKVMKKLGMRMIGIANIAIVVKAWYQRHMIV